MQADLNLSPMQPRLLETPLGHQSVDELATHRCNYFTQKPFYRASPVLSTDEADQKLVKPDESFLIIMIQFY